MTKNIDAVLRVCEHCSQAQTQRHEENTQRFNSLEKRMEGQEQKTAELTKTLAQFIGASKLLAAVIAAGSFIQVVLAFIHKG